MAQAGWFSRIQKSYGLGFSNAAPPPPSPKYPKAFCALEHSRTQSHLYNIIFYLSIKISPGDIDEKSSDVEDVPLQLQSDTVPIRRMSEQRLVKVCIHLFKWSYALITNKNKLNKVILGLF